MVHARNELTFDVVIATRNRPEALALTIPLLLGQSRTPEKLIVIDSSDDHPPVVEAVKTAVGDRKVDLVIEHTEKGLTRQRNRGLTHVTSKIVFFPDDDAVFFPGTSEAIMNIYERDTEGAISAINPAAALEPPPGVLGAAEYEMTKAHQRHALTVAPRTRIARNLNMLSPRYFIGRKLLTRAPEITWLREMDALPVEWMTGYRMTFRTSAIRDQGFEPVFGGYSLFEDTDASWIAWRKGVVVGANRGRIYHHRFPSGRADRYGLGAMGLANLAYLMAKHSADLGLEQTEISKSHKLTSRYSRLRMLIARFKSVRDPGAAEELRGMKAAFGAIDLLFAAPRDRLAETYLSVKRDLGID